MPLSIPSGHPTLVIRKDAYERVGLTRAALDARLGLTDEEFRVERGLVVIGPIVASDELSEVVAELEQLGLVYYEEFFDLSGSWPAWLTLLAMG